jgi:putative ABC transport system ATP-binding protein
VRSEWQVLDLTSARGVSLGIKRGEFIVVYGLSGGGKTTLLNIIGTIDKPTKGEMKLSGTRK